MSFFFTRLSLSLSLPDASRPQSRSGEIGTLQNSVDWRESQRERREGKKRGIRVRRSAAAIGRSVKKVGVGKIVCGRKDEETRELFFRSRRVAPLRLCASGYADARPRGETNHFARFSGLRARQTEGDGTSESPPSRHDPFPPPPPPNNLVYS